MAYHDLLWCTEDLVQRKQNKMTTKAGTLYFMSPEVLSYYYTYKCDIWSLGVILYIMLWGYPPFAADDDDGTYQLIMNYDVEFEDEAWRFISDEAVELISKIFQPEEKRITLK